MILRVFRHLLSVYVAESDGAVSMVETKRRADLQNADVLAKRDAGVPWCRHASDRAAKHGGKPWRYLLIPHDVVAENMTLDELASHYVQKGDVLPHPRIAIARMNPAPYGKPQLQSIGGFTARPVTPVRDVAACNVFRERQHSQPGSGRKAPRAFTSRIPHSSSTTPAPGL